MIAPFKRLEILFWAILPSFITTVLVLLYLTPKHISGLNHFMPVLHLIPVFYWGMLHAREMPYWFVFALGVLIDGATGMPLGLSSLLYIFFLGMVHAQRKYIHKEGFIVKWGYFAGLLLMISVFHWMVMSMLSDRMQGVAAPLIQWLLTVCCYPILHRLFDRLSDRVHHRRWRVLHGR